MYCIKCGKGNVIVADSKTGIYLDAHEEVTAIKGLYGSSRFLTEESANNYRTFGGIITRIEGEYGSIYDMSDIFVAICDGCITDALEDATMIYDRYDIWGLVTTEIDPVEESERRYFRRRALDELTDEDEE
jgi:hypothetical protein